MEDEKDVKDAKMDLELITQTISVCLETGQSEMDEEVSEAARNYYLSIVGDKNLSVAAQRRKIYEDLVVGTQRSMAASDASNMPVVEDKSKGVTLSYRVGLANQVISRVDGLVVCVGQYKENDIYIASRGVSRLHCFMFCIGERLIVLDGWSRSGTRTVSVGRNSQEEEAESESSTSIAHSLPQHRNILQFNVADTIHLSLGHGKAPAHLIINPKPCVVCAEQARTWRLRCGHQVLCNNCFDKMYNTDRAAQCPICRAPFVDEHSVKQLQLVNAETEEELLHLAVVSAGVHTFTVTD